MNRNRKNLHKVKANVLGLTLASVMAVGTAGEAMAPSLVYAADSSVQAGTGKTAGTIYLNGTLGAEADKQDGSSKDKAVASLDKALALAGSGGTVLVCGQITVSSEKSLTIPGGVQIKKAEGYTGSIIKITGKGKLTVTGSGLQASDVDTTGADAGSNAFIQSTNPSGTEDTSKTQDSKEPAATPAPEQNNASNTNGNNTNNTNKTEVPAPGTGSTDKTEGEDTKEPEKTEPPVQKQQGTVVMPDSVTLKSQDQWKEFDFAQAGFQGEGTFAWESQSGPETYESQMKVIFTPKDTQNLDYSHIEGWDENTKTVSRVVKVTVESLKTPDKEQASENPDDKDGTGKDQADKDNSENKDSETVGNGNESGNKTDADENTTDKDETDKDSHKDENTDNVNTDKEDIKEDTDDANTDKEDIKEDKENQDSEEEQKDQDSQEDEGKPWDAGDSSETTEKEDQSGNKDQEADQEQPEATQGKTGEEATELPQDIIPVGSLLDEVTGIRVSGDFIPFYVDLQVSYNDQLSQLPEAGIGDILSAYEICLWDLKEDAEYQVPDGKKVKVMIPLPENAEAFSQLSVAHYLASQQYEYFVLGNEETPGNMTVETIDGIQYLTFETSSFSPFNVGGSQLVGPGSQDKTNTGTSSGSQTGSQSGSQQTGTGTSQNNNSAGQSTAKPGTSGTKTSVNTGTAVKTNTKTRVIRTVKTGDESPVLVYVAVGAAAVVLTVLAFLMGKKRK